MARHYELNNKEYTLKELSEISGLKTETLRARINRYGMTVEESISRPIRHHNKTVQRDYKNIKGKRFGRLTVVKKTKKRLDQRIIWECLCDCGKTVEVISSNLMQGHTQSCGCLRAESSSDSIKKEHVRQSFEKFLEKDTREKGTKISLLDTKVRKDNTSGVTGVTWDKQTSKWRAAITLKGKTYRLGRFENIQDAIDARKEAEEEYFKPILEKYDADEKK